MLAVLATYLAVYNHISFQAVTAFGLRKLLPKNVPTLKIFSN